MHFFFESTVSGESIKITPRIYRENSRITGTQQTFALTADQVSKVKVQMPDESVWGMDYLLDGTFSVGHVRLIGIAGEYTEITDE